MKDVGSGREMKSPILDCPNCGAKLHWIMVDASNQPVADMWAQRLATIEFALQKLRDSGVSVGKILNSGALTLTLEHYLRISSWACPQCHSLLSVRSINNPYTFLEMMGWKEIPKDPYSFLTLAKDPCQSKQSVLGSCGRNTEGD